MSKRLTNILVQYKGGGYDGCFWEWNFFLFDSKGTFHNLISTGYNGIKTVDEAKVMLSNKAAAPYWRAKEYYTYNLNSKVKLKEFQSETAASLVAVIVGKVNFIYKKDIMYWKCDCCGNKQYDKEMFHDGYKGNGGIGVQMLGKLCMDCYNIDSCSYCGTYEAELGATMDEEGRCKYCQESKE